MWQVEQELQLLPVEGALVKTSPDRWQLQGHDPAGEPCRLGHDPLAGCCCLLGRNALRAEWVPGQIQRETSFGDVARPIPATTGSTEQHPVLQVLTAEGVPQGLGLSHQLCLPTLVLTHLHTAFPALEHSLPSTEASALPGSPTTPSLTPAAVVPPPPAIPRPEASETGRDGVGKKLAQSVLDSSELGTSPLQASDFLYAKLRTRRTHGVVARIRCSYAEPRLALCPC